MALSKQMAALAERTMQDPRWAAVQARDASFDGCFWYSVSSTGIYCRPSCPSRLARPEHIAFHASCEAAEAAGFRPCRRCQPRGSTSAQQQAELIAQACRVLETSEQAPGLHELARQFGLSPYYFHRLFKRSTGLTPAAYARAQRGQRVRTALQQSATVTEAIYAAGYNAHGRFYAEADQLLGMRPNDFRQGVADIPIYFALAQCSLGALLVAQSERGICAIWLGDAPEPLLQSLQDRFPQAQLRGGDPEFEARIAQLIAFIEAPQLGLDLPLDIRGTAFQQRVWQALRHIPLGETLSYAELAERIGAPTAVRAVASACAANMLALAVPCHRVVRSDGGLGGYRWGIARKQALLAREASLLETEQDAG